MTIGENHSISQQRVSVFKLKFEIPHFRPQKKIQKNSKRQFDDSDIMQLFSAGTTIFLEKLKKKLCQFRHKKLPFKVWIFFLCCRDWPKQPRIENLYYKCVSRYLCVYYSVGFVCISLLFSLFYLSPFAIASVQNKQNQGCLNRGEGSRGGGDIAVGMVGS